MVKETLRRREQKAASFLARSGHARRPLEASEAKELFRAIDAKQSAGFGIRFLAHVEVDGLHEVGVKSK